MKNRFKMYKGPVCSDEEFAKLFEGLDVGGINFVGPTNSREVYRTFCSCGHCSDRQDAECPVCGKPIMSLNSQYSPRDTHEFKNEYSVLHENSSGDKITMTQVCIIAKMTTAAKQFDIEVKRADTVVFHKEGDKLLPEIIEQPFAYFFLKGNQEEFAKRYPQYEFATSNKARGYEARNFVRIMQAAYALPKVYNGVNFDKCGELLGNILARASRKIVFDDCQFIIPTLSSDMNDALKEYAIKNQGKNGKDLELKDFLWIFGVPPQVENCESYAERALDYEKTMIDQWNVSSVLELASMRRWLDTDFGGWMCHLFNNGRFTAENLRDWGRAVDSFEEDTMTLFYSWIKERADVMDLGFYRHVVSRFLTDCETLKEYGLTITEDNLREKRINALRNEGRYELNEYVDVLEGLKKPTELIIKMAAAMNA